MKQTLLFTLFIGLSMSAFGQKMVEHLSISATSVDVSNETILGEITMNHPSAGKVIVRFDGFCISTPGDRIVLAAANDGSWAPNEKATAVEAIDNDVNRRPFAHVRVYEVSAGPQTYSAVAHNWVETDGDGIISVYGSLTVEFIPENAGLVAVTPILASNQDLSSQTTVGQATINPSESGTAIVRFEGYAVVDEGDRIILAASDDQSWSANDGNVGVEAYDGDINRPSFSHTRVYPVGAGSHTFYAVAHNWVETDGNGTASIYAHLTVEFVPDSYGIVLSDNLADTYDVNGGTQTLSSLKLDAPEAGKVVLRITGSCAMQVGDRILIAVNEIEGWGVNAGHVSMEVANTDDQVRSFSHTRVYDVDAGSHDFYAVVAGGIENDGNGTPSVYSTVSLTYTPNTLTALPKWELDNSVTAFPNPTSGQLGVRIDPLFQPGRLDVTLETVDGQVIQRIGMDELQRGLNIGHLPNGTYLLRYRDLEHKRIGFEKIILTK